MTVAIIVQARMSSDRLPGKVLAPISGRPLLGHLLDRLGRVRGALGPVVATSDRSEDDAIESFCASVTVPCHRGSRDDVALRLEEAAAEAGADAIARVCADSPVLDPALVVEAIETFEVAQPDLVTNTFPRTYPKGQSVEVIDVDALRALRPDMNLSLIHI